MSTWANNWVQASDYHRLYRLSNADAEFRVGSRTFTYNHCECACLPYVKENRVCPFCWVNGRKETGVPAVSVSSTPDAKGQTKMDANFEMVLKAKDEIIAVLKDQVDRLTDALDVANNKLDNVHNRLRDQLDTERKLWATNAKLTDVASAARASLGGIIDLVENDTSFNESDVASAKNHHEDANNVLVEIRETLAEL